MDQEQEQEQIVNDVYDYLNGQKFTLDRREKIVYNTMKEIIPSHVLNILPSFPTLSRITIKRIARVMLPLIEKLDDKTIEKISDSPLEKLRQIADEVELNVTGNTGKNTYMIADIRNVEKSLSSIPSSMHQDEMKQVLDLRNEMSSYGIDPRETDLDFNTLENFKLLQDIIAKSKDIISSSSDAYQSKGRYGVMKGNTITYGDDVSKMIMNENLYPDEVFFSKFANSSLMQREEISPKEESYLFLVDSSGSMRGDKIIQALAIPLALKKRKKKSNVYVGVFSSTPSRIFSMREFPQLLDDRVLQFSGTNILQALKRAIREINNPWNTPLPSIDKQRLRRIKKIVLITDGIDLGLRNVMETRKVREQLMRNKIELECFLIGENDTMSVKGKELLANVCDTIDVVDVNEFGGIIFKRLENE